MASRYLGPPTSARILFAAAAILFAEVVCSAQIDFGPAARWPIRLRGNEIITRPRRVIPSPSTSATLKELIPAKYQKKYLKWKNDYLLTNVGRTEWDRYTLDPDFTLTVTVSSEKAQGAGVGDFRWDEVGKLIAATIILGDKLDSGYPSSINYPITCSLAPGNLPPEVRGTILAATKMAHEFGHLDRIMTMDGRLYESQNRLMVEYNKIFFENGRDAQDSCLVGLVDQMGGTPVSIAQDRESWGEVGALLFLQERLNKDNHIKMPSPVRQAIESYLVTYAGRTIE